MVLLGEFVLTLGGRNSGARYLQRAKSRSVSVDSDVHVF